MSCPWAGICIHPCYCCPSNALISVCRQCGITYLWKGSVESQDPVELLVSLENKVGLGLGFNDQGWGLMAMDRIAPDLCAPQPSSHLCFAWGSNTNLTSYTFCVFAVFHYSEYWNIKIRGWANLAEDQIISSRRTQRIQSSGYQVSAVKGRQVRVHLWGRPYLYMDTHRCKQGEALKKVWEH